MFYSLIDKFYNNTFIKNVAIVATGTACTQAIALAFGPIITRLYGPEAFGVLGTFQAIATVFGPIAALSYPNAIVLPKRDSEALGLARLSLLVATGVTLLIGLLLLIFQAQIIQLLNLETITSFIWLIPLFMFFTACFQVAQQWLIRKKHFSITARGGVATALIVSSIKAVFGLINPVASVLVVLAVFSSALNAALLIIGVRKTMPKKAETSQTTPLRELAKRHWDFPLFRAPETFISQISVSLPVLLLASFFGPAAAGFYTIGSMVLYMPSSLIGFSVGIVFYPRIAEAAHRGENLTRLLIKTTMALGAVGFLPFGLVIIFGPWLFGFVFGAEWVRAGEYGRWLSLWLFFLFLNNPSMKALPVLSENFFLLIFSLFTTAMRIGALALGFYIFKNDLIAVALFSISGTIINIALLLITILKSYRYDQKTQLNFSLA